MSKKQEKKKRSRKMRPVNRKGELLILILAVMILLVSIFTLSYSWFSPDVKNGTGMSYDAKVQVRSENCSIIANYQAAENAEKDALKRKGELKYTVPISNSGTTTVEVPPNRIYYFETVINNADPAATNGSLYIASLPSVAKTYGLGVAYPSNTYQKISEDKTDFCIVRNAYIAGAENGEAGVLKIDWFIKTGDSAVTIDFAKLYWNYN